MNDNHAQQRICMIGARGMLGRELVEVVRSAEGSPELFALDIEDVDITKPAEVDRVVRSIRPQLVINAAAYTDVDGCETRPDLARAANAEGPAHLADACRRYGARLVHVSTDYVFDGTKRTPYVPEDAMNPQSVYGKSKADGETAIREILDNHVIVRTSWLFGVHGKNFVKTILRLSRERDELRLVTDQVGCPTYAPDLAEALWVLGCSHREGIYHFCNSGVCSWNEFAAEIIRLDAGHCRVLPTTTRELGRPAARPAYSVLCTDKLAEHTGIQPRHWTEALAECLDELKQSAIEV